MTLLQDMSETERQSWATVIVDVVVFVTFFQAMTTGWSIDTLTAEGLSQLVIGLIILTIIMHIIIQSMFAVRARGEESEPKDERDIRVERKGASTGFYVLSILMSILLGHIVIQNGVDSIPAITGKHQSFFDYTNTSHLVFAMMTALYLGDIVKNATMILAYRGE